MSLLDASRQIVEQEPAAPSTDSSTSKKKKKKKKKKSWWPSVGRSKPSKQDKEDSTSLTENSANLVDPVKKDTNQSQGADKPKTIQQITPEPLKRIKAASETGKANETPVNTPAPSAMKFSTWDDDIRFGDDVTLEDMTGASNDDNQIISRTRANTMTNADASLDLTSTPPSTAQAGGDSRKRSASVRLSGALRESPQAKKRFSELDKDNSGSISPSDALEFSKGANEILRDEPVSNATIEAVQSKALEELKRNQLPLTYDKLCDVYEDAEKAVNAEDERRQHSPPEDLEQFRRDMDVQGKDVVETNRLKTERLRDHQEQVQSDISDHQMQTMTTREELESKMNELRRVQEEIRQERSSKGMLVNDGKFPACPAFTVLLFLFIWLLLRQMAGDKATHSYPFH